jgi:hypothetical protein
MFSTFSVKARMIPRNIHSKSLELSSQLLIRDESLYSWFETLYQQSGKKEAISMADLRHSLSLALDNTAKSSIYIVLDALDECDDAASLARFLADVTRSPRSLLVKLIIVSRDNPELFESLRDPLSEFLISPNDIRDQIWAYVQQRVAQCRKIAGTKLGREVSSKVSAASDGLWLYARLMMDEIQRVPSPAAIERHLQNIPRGLSELYQQIFATMASSLDEVSLRIAQHIFLWLDLSTFVHVGKAHLDKEALGIVVQAANSGEEVFDCLDLARTFCAPLIELLEDCDGIQIYFIHHTAAQFVDECSKGLVSDIPAMLRPQRIKELYHGATSVWYFGESSHCMSLLKEHQKFRAQNSTKRFPGVGDYFEMAYGLWDAFFLRKLPETLTSQELYEATRLCEILTNFISSEECLRWIEMAIIINYAGYYTELLTNAIRALNAAKRAASKTILPFFQAFSNKRVTFFADYTYVLLLTGPEPDDEIQDTLRDMPEGFEQRAVAGKLLALGRKWEHLCVDNNNAW